MFELARDLRLLDEPGSALGVVRAGFLNLLECDRAVQLPVERDGDLAQPTLGLGPENPERGPADVESPRLGSVTGRKGSSEKDAVQRS